MRIVHSPRCRRYVQTSQGDLYIECPLCHRRGALDQEAMDAQADAQFEMELLTQEAEDAEMRRHLG